MSRPVGVPVSMPMERMRRVTPFFSNRSIMETKSATERASLAYLRDDQSVALAGEGDHLFQSLTGSHGAGLLFPEPARILEPTSRVPVPLNPRLGRWLRSSHIRVASVLSYQWVQTGCGNYLSKCQIRLQ